MDKIKIMSTNLANKIAAGEVIEKCASVVKELVENAIDAGATQIRIDLLGGGLKEITVSDNGSGMSPKDAHLAFEPHATSKLYHADDLFFIDTLGFRGEAIPSIASVAQVTLKTAQDDAGTLLVIKGNQLIKEGKSAALKGTTITVNELFYNTPARLKYLKSETTELANIVALIEKTALAYPQIRFILTNNQKVICQTSGQNNLLKTISEIYGSDLATKMIAINASNEDYTINGYIAKPEVLKTSRNHMTTIVNHRVIRNNEINKAINEAYYTYKPETKFPVVVINITTDTTLIDVNIHPTKQDIKMSKSEQLLTLIQDTIKNALYNHLLIPQGINSSIITDSDVEPVNYEQKVISFNLGEADNIVGEKNGALKALSLEVIGAVHGTYIVAQNEEGMYLIDQHAAQERINYEKYLKALNSETIAQITPLIPINIELSTSDYLIINELLPNLVKMGFILAPFGINTFIVEAHPIWLKEGYEEASIRKIIDLLIAHHEHFDQFKFREQVAITLACKMSIKGNTRLSLEDMNALLEQLVMTDNPYNCPHGRPTIIKYTINDLEKLFKRIMD